MTGPESRRPIAGEIHLHSKIVPAADCQSPMMDEARDTRGQRSDLHADFLSTRPVLACVCSSALGVSLGMLLAHSIHLEDANFIRS